MPGEPHSRPGLRERGCPLSLPVCDPPPANTRLDMKMGIILSSSPRFCSFSPVSMGTVPCRAGRQRGAPEPPGPACPQSWALQKMAQPERRHQGV